MGTQGVIVFEGGIKLISRPVGYYFKIFPLPKLVLRAEKMTNVQQINFRHLVGCNPHAHLYRVGTHVTRTCYSTIIEQHIFVLVACVLHPTLHEIFNRIGVYKKVSHGGKYVRTFEYPYVRGYYRSVRM